MLVRSLTFATLLAVASPLLADDAPLAVDLGKSRPLIVIAPSTADPTLRTLNEALKDPATKSKFEERNLVLYSVAGMVGKRDDKNLEQQTTMALIRELSLGARKGTQVVLVGKDGEKKLEKTVPPDTLDLKEFFTTIDQMPMAEKEAAAAAEPEPAAPAPAKGAKPVKPGSKPAPQQLDD